MTLSYFSATPIAVRYIVILLKITKFVIMDKNDLHTYICEIVDKSFTRLAEIYKCNIEGKSSKVSRLIFPRYRVSNELRISEQELRFIFVEVFTQYCDEKGLELYYSIETPSLDKYDFKNAPLTSEKGQSAMFDLVIFDKYFTRLALIEFKANNADEKSHRKDIVKLNNPKEGSENVLRYFIEVIENSNDRTKESLVSKFSNADSVIIKKIYSLKKEEYLNL